MNKTNEKLLYLCILASLPFNLFGSSSTCSSSTSKSDQKPILIQENDSSPVNDLLNENDDLNNDSDSEELAPLYEATDTTDTKSEIGSLYEVDLDFNEPDLEVQDSRLPLENLQEKTTHGNSLLHLACEKNDIDRVDILLRQFAKKAKKEDSALKDFLKIENNKEESAFTVATRHCNARIIRRLINFGADTHLYKLTKRVISIPDEDNKPTEIEVVQLEPNAEFEDFLNILIRRTDRLEGEDKTNMENLVKDLMLIREKGSTFPLLYAQRNDRKQLNEYYYGHRFKIERWVPFSFNFKYFWGFDELFCVDNEGISTLWCAVDKNASGITEFILKFMYINFFLKLPSSKNPIERAVEGGNTQICELFLDTFKSDSNFIDIILYLSCWNGKYKIVKKIFDKYPQAVKKIKPNYLVAAAGGPNGNQDGTHRDYYKICALLLEKGAKANDIVNEWDEKEKNHRKARTALFRAAKYGHKDTCALLIFYGAKLDGIENAFSVAVRGGHVETCKLLANKGFKLSKRGESGLTPLEWSIYSGSENLALWFLDKGVQDAIRPIDLIPQLQTMIGVAYKKNMLRLLAKLKPMFRTHHSKFNSLLITELMYQVAQCEKSGDIKNLCTQKIHRDVIDAVDAQGNTALMYAALLDRTEAFRELVLSNANLNLQRQSDGLTAIMMLAQNNKLRKGRNLARAYEEIIKPPMLAPLLNLKLVDNSGRTALIIASENENIPLVEALIMLTKLTIATPDSEAGNALLIAVRKQMIDIQDNDGRTALLIAAQKRNTGLCQMLISNGASPNLANKDGETALTIAQQARDPELERILR